MVGRPPVDIWRVLLVAVDSLLVVESGSNDAAGGAAASSSRSINAPTIVLSSGGGWKQSNKFMFIMEGESSHWFL